MSKLPQILQMENGRLQASCHMSDSLDLSVDMEVMGTDNNMERRGTLHLEDSSKLDDNLSTDSLIQEVLLKISRMISIFLAIFITFLIHRRLVSMVSYPGR